MSTPEPLARDSHYVPESYLRRFAPVGDNYVYAYRTLVPRANMRLWEYRSARGIAVRRDLYTSVAEDKESDRIERWLNREVENPAQAVLDRLTKRSSLSALDRRKLARYIASLDARSPVYYSHHTKMMHEYAEGVLNSALDETIRLLSEANKKGAPLTPVSEEDARAHSIAVRLDRGEPGAEHGYVHVDMVIGREYWLDSIEHIVNELSRALEEHDWRVVRPHDGWTWYTTDYPFLRLNFNSASDYNFSGGFASRGTDLLLPLSPVDMLMAQVGKPTIIEQASLEQTYLIKRFVAEHAYRWVVAARPVQHAPWFKPRTVNLPQYRAEEAGWARYHDEQSAAVRELREREATRPNRAS